MELSTRDISRMDLDTVQELKCGQMEPNTKESGEITKLTERVSSGTLMEMSMMETGKTTRPTDTELTFMLMELSMLEPGKTIFKTDKELRAGLMDLSMRVDIRKV
jgi:hypothetical protein